jgi:hypothetical protein
MAYPYLLLLFEHRPVAYLLVAVTLDLDIRYGIELAGDTDAQKL